MQLRTKIKYLFFIVAFFLIAFIIQTHGLEKIRENIDSTGNFTPLALFALRFTSVIIPALPSTIYSILSGALLGFKKGLIVICLADLTSCSIGFFLSRYYGRDFVRNIVGQNFMNKVERFSSNYLEQNIFLIIGFLMTGLFDFVSYGIGLTKTKWNKFIFALVISIGLSNPPIVALGAGLMDGSKKFVVLALIGIFCLAIISGKSKSKIF